MHPDGILEDFDHGPDANGPGSVFLEGFADLGQHGVEQGGKGWVVNLADGIWHVVNAATTCATLPTRAVPVRRETTGQLLWVRARDGGVPAAQLRGRLGELDSAKPTVVYCGGGYRSSVAASLMRQRGFADVSDILGGYQAWEHV